MIGAKPAAIVALLLLPLLWLWPCTFGDRYFVSYDVNRFPPVSTTASDAELAAARDGGNLDVTEVPVWFLPELELARDELRAGRAPSWNPHARAGPRPCTHARLARTPRAHASHARRLARTPRTRARLARTHASHARTPRMRASHARLARTPRTHTRAVARPPLRLTRPSRHA